LGTKGRGSLTSTVNRDIIIKLVEIAVASGARQQLACEEIGISVRTLQRWCKNGANVINLIYQLITIYLLREIRT